MQKKWIVASLAFALLGVVACGDNNGSGGSTTPVGSDGTTGTDNTNGAGGSGDSNGSNVVEDPSLCPSNLKAIDPGKLTTGYKEKSIYGKCVKSITYGNGAGYGQAPSSNRDASRVFPDIVLGPPHFESTGGSLDVLTLGKEGSIVIDFGQIVYDYPGDDLFIFENPFEYSGKVFAEAGKVSVSLDGKTWTSFPCNYMKSGQPLDKTCAGQGILKNYDPATTLLGRATSGGDAFDLSTINVDKFRYVKIEDMSEESLKPTARQNTYGFDLDAVGANVRVSN